MATITISDLPAMQELTAEELQTILGAGRNARLGLESLEDRKLMAANITASLLGDGTLYVEGTEASDKIQVSGHSNGIIQVTRGTEQYAVPIRDAAGTVRNWVVSSRVRQIQVNALGGNDEVFLNGTFASTSKVTLLGGIGNDTLSNQTYVTSHMNGETGADTIYGGFVRDVIWGGHGNDTLYGGDGDDEIAGGDNDDVIWGGNGNDNLAGNWGHDYILGEMGVDTLDGGDGDDALDGGHGNDSLEGGAGNDAMSGGEGDDNMHGAGGNDVLDGNGGNDHIAGGDGDDTLYGSDGADRLFGNNGNDKLYGGSGRDHLDGGNGSDKTHQD
jgi:Ca2+-binding RTX toxin-like protein